MVRKGGGLKVKRHSARAREAEASSPSGTVRAAQALLEARRNGGELIGSSFSSDPALDLLIALFIAAEQGEVPSVVHLCTAANVAPTTALRWLEQLEARRLILRSADCTDARRILILLAPAAHEKVRTLLRRAATALASAAGVSAPF
jgi:DNA-binding MarR family transcriptional regulator